MDLAGVYRRGETKPRYSDSLDDTRQWVSPPALQAGIEAERARPLSAAESQGFVDTQLRLRESSRGLGPEWPERLSRIERDAVPILVPADVQRLTPARPSSAAARSRSTTTARKPPPPGRKPSPGATPERQAPQRRPDGPDTGRGRSR